MGLYYTLIYSTLINNFLNGQQRSWSDDAVNAKAYVGLPCLHMPQRHLFGMVKFIWICNLKFILLFSLGFESESMTSFTTLFANSADNNSIFFLIFPENRLDISCKLSPLETICKKCQSLFSWKSKKNISKWHMKKFLQHAKCWCMQIINDKILVNYAGKNLLQQIP